MIAVALLALAAYVPLTLYPQSDFAHAAFRVAVCLGVAAGIGLPRDRVALWGLGAWGVGIVWSVVGAGDPWRALWSTHNRNEGAWQAAHYLGLTLVACAAPRERVVRWVAVAAGLAAVWGVADLGWVNGWLAGSTGNPLYLAPLLVVGVWGAWRAGWSVLAVILALALGLTGSKGVGLAVLAAGGVLVGQRWPRAALGLGVVVAAGLWMVPIGGSAMIRIELWRIALQGIAAQPIAGWGAEGFPHVWDTFWRGASATGEAWHDRAHSLMLDRWVEWGLVGVAGWGAVVVAAWRRAELPERMVIAAYLGFGLTMFEMMWGAAGFAVVLGYVFHGPAIRDEYLTWAGRWAAVGALFVGAAGLAQSHAATRAADFPAMQEAIEMWSPIGGDLIEVYLHATQTPETLAWAEDRVEIRSPHATQQWFMMAAWSRAYCGDLRATAPTRPDVRFLCGGLDSRP